MPHELLFDVYFLDYGDNQFIGKKDILELRADFLSLRFQAIECFLAHVQPSNHRSKLDEWDEKAVQKFEEMVQVAHWKKLISKVVAYKERTSFAFQRQSNKRESSPIPGVELYDPDENSDKNIAMELVKLGYAEMSDNFGDLSKSAILNSSSADEKEADIIESVKEKSPVKDEYPPLPSLRNEDSTNKNHTNSALRTNGTPEPENLLKAQKPPKVMKKQQLLSDFLKNEQQANSKKPEKTETDWNAMLEE